MLVVIASGIDHLFDGDHAQSAKTMWQGHLTQAALTREDDAAWEAEEQERIDARMKDLAAFEFTGDRERAIKAGDLSGTPITQALNAGLIEVDEAEHLRQQIMARREKEKASGSVIRDTGITAHSQQTLDEEWERVLRHQWVELLPEELTQRELDLTARTGLLPTERAKDIRRGLNAGDPETVAATAQQLNDFVEAHPDLKQHLDPEAFPPQEVERGLKIAAATNAGHPIDEVLKAVGKNEIVPTVSADPDNGDQVAMGAAGPAIRALGGLATRTGGKALEQARKRGREIRDLVRKQARKPNEKGELPKPNPISAAEIVTTAKRLFDEINEQRQLEGKKERKKIQITPDELQPGATPEDAIEGLAEAVMSGEIAAIGNDVIEIRIAKVSTNFAERVLAETGIDVSGLEHAIDTQGINHANAGHGPENENDADQEPISPEALSIYVDAVESFDRVSKIRRKDKGETITFEKDVNGVVMFVQQVRRNSGALSFFNMWIKKRPN